MGAARLPAANDKVRAAIHDCLGRLIAQHLHELNPLIWSQALIGPDLAPSLPPRRALLAKGRQAALRVNAERFSGEIANGGALAFSSAGMYQLPAL